MDGSGAAKSGTAVLLGVTAAAFALGLWYVNPLREAALCDDWAYALTCWRMADTGVYRPHDWLAANMPFQAWWGTFFVKALGRSFAAVRLSTLMLTLTGLGAFYLLGRELGESRSRAALLTLGLAASPLVVRMSFTFMTNVPFLALVLVSLWLYVRGWRRGRSVWVGLGSLAAAAAILTRQFGVAVIPGVLAVWLLGSERRRRLPLVLLGVALPAAAGAWQVWVGVTDPPWGGLYARLAQKLYFGNRGALLLDTLARPAIVLQYLALFTLPFVGVALVEFVRGQPRRRAVAWTVAVGLYVLAAMVHQRIQGRPAWMPYLPWNLEILAQRPPWVRIGATLVTAAGAVTLARLFWLRWVGAGRWRNLSPGERLVDIVSVCLLGMHLVFFQIGDEYLLVLLPLALLALGKHLGAWLDSARVPVSVACLLVWALSAEWTRATLAEGEAQWQAAEALADEAGSYRAVHGPWTWVAYHGFEEYLQDIGGRPRHDLREFWDTWLPAQLAGARYWLRESPEAAEGWELYNRVPYRGLGLRKRYVYVWRRAGLAGSAADRAVPQP